MPICVTTIRIDATTRHIGARVPFALVTANSSRSSGGLTVREHSLRRAHNVGCAENATQVHAALVEYDHRATTPKRGTRLPESEPRASPPENHPPIRRRHNASPTR
jgi:hypothetical protein